MRSEANFPPQPSVTLPHGQYRIISEVVAVSIGDGLLPIRQMCYAESAKRNMPGGSGSSSFVRPAPRTFPCEGPSSAALSGEVGEHGLRPAHPPGPESVNAMLRNPHGYSLSGTPCPRAPFRAAEGHALPATSVPCALEIIVTRTVARAFNDWRDAPPRAQLVPRSSLLPASNRRRTVFARYRAAIVREYSDAAMRSMHEHTGLPKIAVSGPAHRSEATQRRTRSGKNPSKQRWT